MMWGMPKPRQADLYLPHPVKAPAARRVKAKRTKKTRRRLLLIDYKTWLEVTQDVARAAEAGRRSA
jgi:hypothetical protein